MSNKQNDILFENTYHDLVSILREAREGGLSVSIKFIAVALSEVMEPEELNSLRKEIKKILILEETNHL